MIPILTSAQMRDCDIKCIQAGTASAVLMSRAADAVLERLRADFDCTNALFVCGAGNNGGDGLLAAAKLKESGTDCAVFLVGGSTCRRSEENRRSLDAATAAGVHFTDSTDFSGYSVIVDAVLGIGACGAPRGACLEAVKAICAGGTPVLSVDVPSGVDSDSGEIPGAAVCADETVTVSAYKRGLLLAPGVGNCGKTVVADIGIPCAACGDAPLAFEKSDLEIIPARPTVSNKGTFGRVLVVAGSRGMCGAAYLSAKAAYRSGAGLVEIFTCEENRAQLQTLIPEAIVTAYEKTDAESLLRSSLRRATVVVVGPGLSVGDESEAIVKTLYEECGVPIVIDADALNITAKYSLTLPRDVPCVVTPHPGEMARLINSDISHVVSDLWGCAERFAKESGAVCVLKSERSVISDGEKMFVNPVGTSALAKGGSGDVLSGIIGAFLAVGMIPVYAAAAAVYVHSLAGIAAAEKMGEYSPLAGEVCDMIPQILKEVHKKTV